jgi:hypothetical protein
LMHYSCMYTPTPDQAADPAATEAQIKTIMHARMGVYRHRPRAHGLPRHAYGYEGPVLFRCV